MGEIIAARYLSSRKKQGLLRPVVYCCSFMSNNRDTVSLNKAISERLAPFESSARSIVVEKVFRDVILTLPNDVTICDFDVLFNPTYKIDVLRMMTTICKSKPFSIVWPGRLVGRKLVYAEEGYPDHKEFNIDDYDITCIK